MILDAVSSVACETPSDFFRIELVIAQVILVMPLLCVDIGFG